MSAWPAARRARATRRPSVGAVHDGPRTPGGAVAGGRAFVPAADALAAISLDDGSVEWSRRGGSRGTPAVADGTCYRLVAGDRTRVEALDAASGERRWERALPGRHHRGGLAVGESTLYVTGTEWTLRCLDRESGDPVWAAGDTTGIGPPALGDGRLFVTTDGGVVARDARTGSRRWRRGLFAYDAPAFDGERVVVGARGKVRAFGPDGTPRWTAEVDGPVRGTPALAGETAREPSTGPSRSNSPPPRAWSTAHSLSPGGTGRPVSSSRCPRAT